MDEAYACVETTRAERRMRVPLVLHTAVKYDSDIHRIIILTRTPPQKARDAGVVDGDISIGSSPPTTSIASTTSTTISRPLVQGRKGRIRTGRESIVPLDGRVVPREEELVQRHPMNTACYTSRGGRPDGVGVEVVVGIEQRRRGEEANSIDVADTSTGFWTFCDWRGVFVR